MSPLASDLQDEVQAQCSQAMDAANENARLQPMPHRMLGSTLAVCRVGVPQPARPDAAGHTGLAATRRQHAAWRDKQPEKDTKRKQQQAHARMHACMPVSKQAPSQHQGNIPRF
jgi:hypothetical protein